MRLVHGMALLVVCALAAACGVFDSAGDGDGQERDLADPGDCIVVDMAVSSEKADLMRDLARTFNGSEQARVDGECVFVRPQSKASGGAMTLLSQGWPDEDAEGPRPVVWSPASSAWGAILNQRLADRGEPDMAPPSEPFMLTPLVIAMPEPMADALGYPDTPVGFADILELARSAEGWGAFGHPEWGPFRLGKTNPNFSTSGLSALIAQYYAATGKVGGLTVEDLGRPEVEAFARGVESAVVHYGDTTLTFLNNWFRTDARGTSLTYASAVAVEEKSVIDYNRGNPDGVLDLGEQPEPPRIPLVAVYPEEGTLFSDNPYIVLDAPWVDDRQREGARLFEQFVQRPENQQRVLEFGFRPGNTEVALAEPISAANGVDPAQPQTTLEIPEPPVMVAILDRWAEQRKSARVLMVIDVSGSMGDAAGGGTRDTKLDLAKRAAIEALDQFKADDDVGLRIFSTDLSGDPTVDYLDLVPTGPVGEQRELLASRIRSLVPTAGTPLYTVAQASFNDMLAGFDRDRINAVVLLTDGRNEDPRNADLEGLLGLLRSNSEGQTTRPVRIFPIAYGSDADLGVLRRIAEATNARAYDASDPATIVRVFTEVVSNF
ncbi:MAG TPA: extracellular solute-binding protein [Egibacteraceae bacterium]|nr:substrate-binding and VWA domain-containing protein [Actinomycetota bacterium]HWB71813.1 extracellular solute-binding protein [Egibacteraceae bacterium]